jgi:acetyl-CoA acetyltransferase
MNANGSGISIGHPVRATGGRILATLAREMVRRDARYGVETMCIGGGQASPHCSAHLSSSRARCGARGLRPPSQCCG